MKGIKNIIELILIIILAICMITIGIITTVSSTILDKNYVISKLEEADFYHETYQLVISNFENYIYQSGLEETILEDICTEVKVKKDINIMIANIYEGMNKEIETQSIEDNLNKKIDDLNVKNKENENAINQFVKQICDEYKSTLVHTNYENSIHENYVKVKKIIKKIEFVAIVIALIDIIILLTLNMKEMSKCIRAIGIALLTNGLFEMTIWIIIKAKVNIQGIKILNEAFSATIVKIIEEIMRKIQDLGIIAIIVAILLIIICAITENKKSEK